jgi:hypothetical protein
LAEVPDDHAEDAVDDGPGRVRHTLRGLRNTVVTTVRNVSDRVNQGGRENQAGSPPAGGNSEPGVDPKHTG